MIASLEDLGVNDPRRCEGCAKTHPSWAMYEQYEMPICGVCYNHLNPIEVEEPPPPAPWDTEVGKYLKAERNMRLDKILWVNSPGSPCTEACQEETLLYRKRLNRMTLDYLPEAWEWPAEPVFEYESA